MNFRRALHEQALQHGLDPQALAKLYQLARLTTEPERLPQIWLKGYAIAGGALAGMAAIMWVAANWTVFGHYGRLALAEAFVLLPVLALLGRPQWRLLIGVFALLGIGALLACIGQTYQTGADPWQLFALWALLALPLCLGIRHEVLWLPWVLVVTTAISLLQYSQMPVWGYGPSQDLFSVWLLAWMAALLLVVASRHSVSLKFGVGVWSRGLAFALSALLIATPAMNQVWYQVTILYWLALLLFLAAAAAFSTHQYFDMPGLVLALLALNALLDSGSARLLLEQVRNSDLLGVFFLIVLAWAAVLYASTKCLMHAFKREGVMP